MAFERDAPKAARPSTLRYPFLSMTRTRTLIVTILLSSFSIDPASAEQKLPFVSCTLGFAEGSFFGYGPPEVGDVVQFDLNRLNGLEGKIDFEQPSMTRDEVPHYIPLEEPLAIVGAVHHDDGRLQHIRSASSSSTQSSGVQRRLTLDFNWVPGAGKGPDYVRLWIVDEQRSINSVARADCVASYEDG